MNLTNDEINKLNDFGGFLSFKPTWAFRHYVNLKHKIICLFTGNQALKTSNTSYIYVLRVFGKHPVPKKNVVYFECEHRMKAKLDNEDSEHKGELKKEYLSKHKNLDSATFIFSKIPKDKLCPECGGKIIQHQRGSRVFRFCSETLPGQSANVSKEGESAEVKNTQYPEFKKWLPPFLIKKDITFRNPALTIRDIFGGKDIIVEFVSYNQSVQSTAGHQRISIWLDEEPPMDFLEEQHPRLIAEDGDLIITNTPADRITYLYDMFFEKAKVFYRTNCVVAAYKKYLNQEIKNIEITDSVADIAVIQAATDDNPTLSQDDVESLFESTDDPDVLAIRRYGIFKQVSGRIFKTFNWDIHFIPSHKYFPIGIPKAKSWVLGRVIDYHEHIPWAIGFVGLSPTDEAFIFDEYNPSPEKYVTMEIAEKIAHMSKDYKFTLDLIDPLATKTQTNTGTSVLEDLNRIFWAYKKEGIGMGAYWESGDTKSTIGRDEIRKRLKNSALVGKPFNNMIDKNGKQRYLPTLWILDNCREFAKSIKSWRLEEWAKTSQLATKDMKDKPQQKWSHFCTSLEFLFKDRRFKAKPMLPSDLSMRKPINQSHYFQGREAHAR